jgi:hypothetical protein
MHNRRMTVALTWIGWAVGLLAATLTLYQWSTSRNRRRAQDRAFEILNQQLIAADAKEEVEHYQQLRLDLRRQVDREIPAEARKAYLRNRLDGLAKGISDDYEEYRRVQQELNVPQSSELDQRIQAVVRQNLVPSGRFRRNRERAMLGLIAFLAIFSLTPISYVNQAYIKILSEPAAYSIKTFDYMAVLSVVFWSIVLSMVFAATPLGAFFRNHHMWSILIGTVTIITFSVLAFATYGHWIDIHSDPPLNENTFAYEYHTRFLYLYWLVTLAAISAGAFFAAVFIKVGQMWRAVMHNDVAQRSVTLDAQMGGP